MPRRLRGEPGGKGLLVADILVWVMERRVVLADRAERLRKELAEIDAEVVRLEAAEMVIRASPDVWEVLISCSGRVDGVSGSLVRPLPGRRSASPRTRPG